MDILEELVRLQVVFVQKILRRDLEDILSAEVRGPVDHWGHSNYRHPAFTLCYLYRLDHPANPFRGDEWCAETAMRLIDTFVAAREAERAEKPLMEETEWPPYAVCYALEVLEGRLGTERVERWRRYVEDWVATSLIEPAFFTSPNHELWRFRVLYAAGRVLDRSDWCERALFFTRQLIHWQTPEGFWEEGVHHGPSMKYNHLALAPLAWLCRASGDEAIGRAAQRLARFMSRFTFPDGTTVGCFDGRQSMSPGYFAPACPGLELAPGGLTLIERMLGQRRRLGALDDPRAFDSSNWYAYFGIIHFSDACRYFETVLAQPEAVDPAACSPLVLDADGALVENHSTVFDGVAVRRGAWVAAISGQESDVPKIGSWVYRLERQSRISLWHRRAGVVAGGGHNLAGQAVPLTNVILTTGYGAEVRWGKVLAENTGKARSTYICRAAETSFQDGCGILTVHFLHGSVTFRVEMNDENSAVVHFEWRQQGVERLAVQVPVVVWRGGTVTLAGREIEPPPGDLLGLFVFLIEGEKTGHVSLRLFDPVYRVSLGPLDHLLRLASRLGDHLVVCALGLVDDLVVFTLGLVDRSFHLLLGAVDLLHGRQPALFFDPFQHQFYNVDAESRRGVVHGLFGRVCAVVQHRRIPVFALLQQVVT